MADFKDLSIDEKREVITAILHEGEATVEFTKVDGTLRKMPCTLNPDLFPPTPMADLMEAPEPKKERKENPGVIRAFCTDKQEWRSFRIENVITITR